jgi:hypothetical protein
MADDDIRNACHQHGARRVYNAAYARLIGDYRALKTVGLPGIVDLGEANTIARIAIGEMSDSERAEFRTGRLEP